MQKNNLILLESKELQEINRKIVPLFGIRNMVSSGSYKMSKGRITRCDIAIGETNTFKTVSLKRSIGKKVKDIIKAEEVYSFGIRLA